MNGYSGISPAQPIVDSARQWISVLGTDFVPGSTVTLYVGGNTYPIPQDRTQYRNSTEIDVFVGLTDARPDWSVRVAAADGAVSNQLTFPVVAKAAQLPDLVVSSLSVNPIDVAAGGEASVAFTVLNQGNFPAPSTHATIRLGSVTTITPQDPLLADVTVPTLGIGQSRSFSPVVKIPAGAAIGDSYVVVTANDVAGVGRSSVALSVPLFKQTDSRWSVDPMIDENGVNQGSVGIYGCAMTSAAMVAAYYGMNSDPGQLNAWLSSAANKGYQSGGYIYWSKAADYTEGKMAYQSSPESLEWTDTSGNGAGTAQWTTLQSQLSLGRPVIVKEYLSGQTHWVVVTGFAGGSITDPAQYSINDPSQARTSLADYGTFYAIRVYSGASGAVPESDRTNNQRPTRITVTSSSPQPEITGIWPPVLNPSYGSFTIMGRNFHANATVGLRDPAGNAINPVITDRTGTTAITINQVFGSSGRWSVTVTNPGENPVEYNFGVGPGAAAIATTPGSVGIDKDTFIQEFVTRFGTGFGTKTLWQIVGLNEAGEQGLYSEARKDEANAKALAKDYDQLAGMRKLLWFVENDPNLEGLQSLQHQRWAAYILATVRHETKRAWNPVQEEWNGSDPWYYFEYVAGTPAGYGGRLGNAPKGAGEGFRYRGRGYVQITGKDNYAKFSFDSTSNSDFKQYLNDFLTKLGESPKEALDLVSDPNLALNPEIAYAIMSFGMTRGSFRGDSLGRHSLPRWIPGDANPDYFDAREIVNGDKNKTYSGYTQPSGKELAQWATTLEGVLKASLTAVQNGSFAGGTPIAWSTRVEGGTVTIQPTGIAYSAQLTLGSPVDLSQAITTPDEPFDVTFDYQFRTATGALDVILDSVSLATISAPSSVPDGPSTFRVTVSDPSLLSQQDAILDFHFDGLTGSQIDLTHIATQAVLPSAYGSAEEIPTGGGATQDISVIYTDSVAIDVSTLGTGDVLVTGPNGYSQLPTFVGVDNNSNGSPRAATYRITAPNGLWGSGDNGTYTLTMQVNEVSDTRGNYVPYGVFGSFAVTIPPAPIRDLAWEYEADMPQALRDSLGAVLDGKIHVVGGNIGNAHYRYDPSANTWTTLASPPAPVSDGGAVVVNSKLYAIGYWGTATVTEIYDPASNSWSTGAPMPTARDYAAVATVGGRVYAIGGRDLDNNPFSTV